MKKILYLAIALALSCNTAQKGINENVSTAKSDLTDPSVTFASSISEEELKTHLYTYASDEFEGRETGEPGQKKAVEYLRKQYQMMGIPAAQANGDYFQKVPLQVAGAPKGNILINNTNYAIGEHLITFSNPISGDYDIIYAGYGIETDTYSDYKNMDVSGKFVLIKSGEPKNSDGTYTLSNSNKPTDWSNWRESLANRFEIAKSKGAVGILYYDDSYFSRVKRRYDYYTKSNHSGSMSFKSEEQEPVGIIIDKSLAESLISDISTNNQVKDLNVNITLDYNASIKDVDTENVVSVIKGSEKPNEYIVISSHLDHIGISGDGEINNGADDDGSGSVAMLEIAEAFKKAEMDGFTPKRSIVFLHVTGEEKGLFGSAYYAEHPIFPLEQTVADLNIDMIGRIDPKREGDRNYIYLIGADKLSSELHEISEATNEKYCKIELDYKYNDENDPNRFYYRSDHYNFAKNNVPVIFYFNGTHDDYHRPSDTPDKINYDLLANRAKLVFHTAWELANREERIVVDKITK
ncbi:Peptidase family M28 [Zhouia amylolytica]|uniref:Peptidase family M28 n=2 Tax=Zhouia amylolytica TaxID=376730 RepID=A0A1I6QLP3_9FLAO|nr:M28 family peptidase [Zhouia amylolytica]ETN95913.1 putative aminopeptidase [Zhouia amylolytica AD3]MCQ0111963.1 M28 family peptidase [Zhouia amylolytica]SFS53395.1 Peptidase family M28 [Zhouia amylolytica]